MSLQKNMCCSFDILQPMNRFNITKPGMQDFLRNCQRFEELFYFRYTTIKDVWMAYKDLSPLTVENVLKVSKKNFEWDRSSDKYIKLV